MRIGDWGQQNRKQGQNGMVGGDLRLSDSHSDFRSPQLTLPSLVTLPHGRLRSSLPSPPEAVVKTVSQLSI